MFNRPLLVVLLGCGILLSKLRAEEWSYTYSAGPRDAFSSAEFLLSLEPQIKSPKGIILLVGPQGVDMRKEVKASPWNRVAKEQECAVLGCLFGDKEGADFSRVDQGGRSAVLAVLNNLSGKSERLRDLGRLKIVPVGRLAGAQFAYEFASRDSERVAGFVCINPYYFNAPPSAALRKIPGFFLVASKEHPISAANVLKMYVDQRKFGALWARIFWEEDPKKNKDMQLAGPFVEQVLIARINRRNPITSVETFKNNDGWSLDLSSFDPPTIMRSGQVARGREDQYAWFCSENLAEAVAKVLLPPAPAQ
jgi:hypothetical protein